jgi:ABC-type dipeptide/oligopeptide/nickel transport system permease component
MGRHRQLLLDHSGPTPVVADRIQVNAGDARDALTALMAESGNVSARELQKLRKDLGLDLPYYEQYLIWLWQMLSLNPGYSIFASKPIPVALKSLSLSSSS